MATNDADDMDDTKAQGKHAVYTRVPEATYRKLVKLAERDQRSVSAYVLKLILQDIGKRRV